MFILKNNPSLRRMRLMRRDFGATCTQKGIAVRRSLSVRSCFGATCTNSYTSDKTTSNGGLTRADTRVTKFLAAAHYTQAQGRSMVEMLGVLAIIGVLSVGAIAGYSKAMFKYKLNKQAEQISWLMNIMTQYQHEWKFNKHTNLVPYYTKMNLIDRSMLRQNEPNTLYDSFNNQIKLTNNRSPDFDEILMSIHFAVNNREQRFNICQNVITIAQQFSDNLRYLNVSSFTDPDDNTTVNYTQSWRGDKNCSQEQNNCLRLKTMNDVYEMCQTCNGSARCGMNIVWKIN